MINRMKHVIWQLCIRSGTYVSPALLAAICVLLVTAIALFTPPYIGMADNGDFYRISYSNGIYFNLPDYDDQYLGYFVKSFGIFQFYNENQSLLFSSQSLFIQLALFLNKLFLSGQVFDIRVLGVILTLLYTAAVYLLVESITWKKPKKYGYPIALLAVFMFGDTGYTAYFNSFYGESVVFITTLLLFASWLLFYRNRYNDYFTLAVFIGSAVLLTTSKQQNAPVGLIIACMAAALLFMRTNKGFRILTVVSMVGLLGAGIASYVLIPKDFVNINQYHAMTRGVLLHSDNPEKTLNSFDMNKQYAILKGTLFYDPYTPVDVNSPVLENDFFKRYGFGSILAYYALHPGALGTILDDAAKDAFTIRPEAMGNYESSAGKPFGAQTHFFSGYSLLKKAAAPKTIGFIVIWILIVIGLHLPACVAAVKDRNFRYAQKLVLIAAMIAIGLSGILVAIIGAGDADLAKHEFLFTLTFDLVTFLTIADCLGRSLFYKSGLNVDAEPLDRPGQAPGGVPVSI